MVCFSWLSDVVQKLSKMLKKVKAFIALTAFMTAVRCEINIYYSRDQQEIDKQFNDAPSLFGGSIPSDGIKVI